ncbi:MAG: outer membrane beta-barrel protein [Proteobacteria bacterium]|nr:outer membrane beta-barrel protein [Pseudomonadota bacterium]
MIATLRTTALAVVLLCSTVVMNSASAQDVRYAWFEFGVLGQDVQKTGSFFDLALNQSVDIDASDGAGTRFRGSIGPWRNYYTFFNFETADPKVEAVVTNTQGVFPAEDTFDLTSIRVGIGYKYSLNFKTDLIAEIAMDSVDYDFGSFAGEDFDISEKDVGGTLGVRYMLNDNFEIRAHARYTNVGDVNLTEKFFDSDILFGAGLGFTLIRGLSITLDYETGKIETVSIGFRLDLDED